MYFLRGVCSPDTTEPGLCCRLRLAGCRALTSLEEGELPRLRCLAHLSLTRCDALRSLPDLYGTTSLQTLILDGCASLACLPDLSKLPGCEV